MEPLLTFKVNSNSEYLHVLHTNNFNDKQMVPKSVSVGSSPVHLAGKFKFTLLHNPILYESAPMGSAPHLFTNKGGGHS